MSTSDDEKQTSSASTTGDQGTRPEADWERKRRLAEIFGDVLPSTTRDERDPAPPSRRESAQDAWLKSQVPPHHGS